MLFGDYINKPSIQVRFCISGTEVSFCTSLLTSFVRSKSLRLHRGFSDKKVPYELITVFSCLFQLPSGLQMKLANGIVTIKLIQLLCVC